jgi:pescadillo protein
MSPDPLQSRNCKFLSPISDVSASSKVVRHLICPYHHLTLTPGIFPREPRSRKKANKGSSAPTSFYYAKDIAYLAHEPVLKKLREHKAFAKRFARALGRGEWSSAKSLEDHKPVYKIDHIVKERYVPISFSQQWLINVSSYPSFIDAVRDIDDALCLIFLFATLPPSPRVPAKLVESCARLAAEWQLYIIKAKALRKVFLSIKGVYYQAEIMGEQVTWLVPYAFTPNVSKLESVSTYFSYTFADARGRRLEDHAHFPGALSDAAWLCHVPPV